MPPHGFSLFDDNPASIDLLGLEPIAVAIADAALDDRLDPVTVGINSPWGGGKSTALRLVELELRRRDGVLVVKVDPWEFVDTGDPRGTLITRVLEGVQDEYERRQSLLAEGEVKERAAAALGTLKEKVVELSRRISWTKVAQVAAKSLVTLTPDIPGFVDALTPKDPTPEQASMRVGMREFRKQFGKLISELPTVDRVVVLVDDLDRCLPGDVLGALEAIKLFLSVEGMAFVIAADDSFIRESLRDALDRQARGRFADSYTEKVIQLPFTLPQMTLAGAEAYLTLLLACADAEKAVQARLAQASLARRTEGVSPYAYEGMVDELPTREMVEQAASMVYGMAPSQSSTPRQLKRFLNNLAIRARVLGATSGAIDLGSVMKLWVLEQNFPTKFAELGAQALDARSETLRGWENADDSGPDAALVTWARNGVQLSEKPEDVTAYLSLAATVVANVSVGPDLNDEETRLLRRLLSESELVRQGAQDDLAEEPQTGDAAVAQQLAAALLGGRRDQALDSLQSISLRRVDLIEPVSSVLNRADLLSSITRTELPYFANYPATLEALLELRAAEPMFADAIRDEMRGEVV